MSDPTGPTEAEQFKAMLTHGVAIFLRAGDDEAAGARELAAGAATVDDAARELAAWFEGRLTDFMAGKVSPGCLADVWPGMAYQALPLVDWARLAHQVRDPDNLAWGGTLSGQ